jgi:hypothetical protein
MLMVRAKRPATRPLRGWAISVLHEAGAIKECEEHSWMQEATALPGNEAALRVAIDEVIPRSLAEAGVEVFPAARGPRKSGPLRALRAFRQSSRSGLPLRLLPFQESGRCGGALGRRRKAGYHKLQQLNRDDDASAVPPRPLCSIVNETALIDIFPRLYHVTDGGAWASIRTHGLLSTSALLALYGVQGPVRTGFESERRPAGVTLRSDGLPDVLVRDQSPISDRALLRCLTDGMTPREWYRILNGKVFFWTSMQRLQRLLTAKAGRDVAQLVLTVDTQSLVDTHRDRVRLSGMNTGSTIRKPLPRGPKTFLPIAEFPYDERRRTRAPSDALVELVVEGAVPDIMDHLIEVDEVGPDRRVEVWRRAPPDADTASRR